MHLWPSMRLRDSFKESYLSKLEWNLHLMNTEKRQQQGNKSNCRQQKLLETNESNSETSGCGGIGVILREILMILSCCYCCFCCGDDSPKKRNTEFQPINPTLSSPPFLNYSAPTPMSKFKHPIAEASETSPFGSLSPDEFYARHSVDHGSEFITSKQNLKLFTQWWTPQQSAPLKGVVCVVHGYTGESSWFVQLTAVHVVKHGFAVCAIDHMGHGFSEGLIAHIPDINVVVDDCISFFDGFRARFAPDLPAFLYSESLGGAIALLIVLRREGIVPARRFDGVVLNGAMCGISDKFKPPWPLEHFLSIAAFLIPTWSVVPTRGSIPNVSFKVDWKRKLALASPRRPTTRPRAATAQELMRVSREVQGKFSEVDVPFLIVHGGDDIVCDPACAEELYNRAASKDKTLRIYPGMWHQLVGEPEESVELVFGEVIDWLLTRAERAAPPAGG